VANVFSRPQLELNFRLRDQHIETTERFATGFVSRTQESCLDRIVDEVVNATAA
jgi:hypothetical protein